MGVLVYKLRLISCQDQVSSIALGLASVCIFATKFNSFRSLKYWETPWTLQYELNALPLYSDCSNNQMLQYAQLLYAKNVQLEISIIPHNHKNVHAFHAPTSSDTPNHRNISKIRILVPGAGLGRLTYELAHRGFYCEGNEFSLFMLVASNFVLNKCVVENQYTMYPWVHQFVNNLSRCDQVRPVSFPDVSPTKAKPKGGFNMVAGDFLQVRSSAIRLEWIFYRNFSHSLVLDFFSDFVWKKKLLFSHIGICVTQFTGVPNGQLLGLCVD